jgi:hypothetical protein
MTDSFSMPISESLYNAADYIQFEYPHNTNILPQISFNSVLQLLNIISSDSNHIKQVSSQWLCYFYQFQPELLFSALFNIGFHQENNLDQILRFTALNIITLFLSVRNLSQFQSLQEKWSQLDSGVKNEIAQYLFKGLTAKFSQSNQHLLSFSQTSQILILKTGFRHIQDIFKV